MNLNASTAGETKIEMIGFPAKRRKRVSKAKALLILLHQRLIDSGRRILLVGWFDPQGRDASLNASYSARSSRLRFCAVFASCAKTTDPTRRNRLQLL